MTYDLVVIGSGPGGYVCAIRAAQLGLGDRLRYLDYVPAPDLPGLYAGARAFVFPSLYEGFGFPVLEYVNKISTKPLDAHLMIVDPAKFIPEVQNIGAHMMTVHYEACTHLDRTIHQIKEAGMKAGVSLNPHTPEYLLEDIINDIDMVLIMSVNPGYGNQKFIPYSLDKIRRLKEMILRKNANTLIQVDGGVNLETGRQLVDAGTDILVAGSFVFNSADPMKTIADLKSL